MRVGVAGLGRMGTGIALRLLDSGIPVTVWNRTMAKTVPLAEKGAAVASTPCELVNACDVVISMLLDDAAVQKLFLDPEGILSQPVEDKLFIEMSTIRPDTVRELGAAVVAKGAGLLGAPVGGSKGTAARGQLLVTVGGSAADLVRAEPVLKLLARRIVHVGPLGDANVMALIMRLGMAVYNQFLGEALAMGMRSGLARDTILDILTDGPLTCRLLTKRMPQYKESSGESDCTMIAARKDVLSAIVTGSRAGVGMPTAAATLEALSAAIANGWGDRDFGELPLFVRGTLVTNLE